LANVISTLSRPTSVVALTLIFIGFIAATLSPQHLLPIPSFYQEIAAGAGLLLGAFTFLFSRGLQGDWNIPWSSLTALALVAVLLIGVRVHPESSVDFLLWPVGSLIVGAMAAWLGHQFARAGHADWLINGLLFSLALLALGTTVVLWVQLFLPNQQSLWLFPRQVLQAPSGNLGQRNQSSLLLGFGLLAFAYWGRHGVPWLMTKRSIAILAILFIVSGMALTQSRIALGFLLISGLSLGALWALPTRRWRGALWGLFIIGSLYAILQWLIYTGFGLGQLFPPSTQRLADRGIGQRLGMLHVAWAEFTSHPIFGGGFGSFSDWEFRLGLQQSHPLYSTNAHNIFAQIGAELGLFGLLALLLPSGISLWFLIRRLWKEGLGQWPGWTIASLGICAMLLGYSLTEFPLWYVYFLIPFALCWGALDQTAIALRITPSVKFLLGLIPLLMLAFMSWSSMRYFEIVKLTAIATNNAVYKENKSIYQQQLQSIISSPGFSPIIEALNFYSLSVDPFMLKDKVALGERAASYYISAWFLQKLSYLYAIDHNPKKAAQTLAKACAFYPNDCPYIRNGIIHLQTLDSKIYSPVAIAFFKLPQSKIQPTNVNILKPWMHGNKGSTVTIDPKKTLFGFDLAVYASGLSEKELKSGTFIATPIQSNPASPTSHNPALAQ
jgi:O-antigen ligase